MSSQRGDQAGRLNGGATDVSYDDLVTAATVGVSRRPFPIAGLAGPAAGHAAALDADDPAAALLDAAALLTVARRGGYRPGPGVAGRPPASPEPAPELPARAERALRLLGGAQLAPGFAAGDKELLADLLKAAAGAGYVASAPLLPDLLDAATRAVALRPVVVALLGQRGRWLAAQRPDWQRIVAATAAEMATPGSTAVNADDPEVWRTGSRAERLRQLAGQRERDPDAGRALLAADWSQLAVDERTALLAVLARGLSAGDEEFLDAALDDRAPAVRAVARRLLTRLPASQLGRRAIERAAAVLRLERDGRGQRLAARPPGKPDAVAIRDGIDPTPPTPAIAVGPWALTQIIAAVPLTRWATLFGLPPADIAGLPIMTYSGPPLWLDVHAGWRLAAVSQGSGEWAEALLTLGDPADGGGRPPNAWPSDQRLAAVLAPDRRAARVAALLAETTVNAGPGTASQALAEVSGGPVPWPAALADAVLALLDRAGPLAALPRLPRGLLDLAGRGLPAIGDRDYAAELTRLGDRYPQTWTPLVRKTAETIRLRRAFLEEIR